MNANELSSRLQRLERENRRMKRAGFAVVGVALAVALIGAATPNEIPDAIEARAFRVIDTNGKLRVEITTGPTALSSTRALLSRFLAAAGLALLTATSGS